MSESNKGQKPKGIIHRFTSRLLRRPEGSVREPRHVDTAKAILNQTKLTEVASHWSGLPARREYYDERDLMKIYDLVSRQVGKSAGHSFANMVIDMPSLAPANMVRAIISLARNNWIYDPYFSGKILEGQTDIRPVRPDEAETIHDAVAEGFFGAIAATTENKSDESDSIREAFKTSLGNDLERVMATRVIIDDSQSHLA